jgi:alkanesulfonate monooxygenase SsuD/methylene tetrahydromethanopterin reductase-like flavin-dependent oxidoreductase (luciferase family)
VVAPHSKGVIAMGERDFHPLSANFLLAHWLPSHWKNYAQGKTKAGQTAQSADWRIARTIFVADDDKLAARYGRYDESSPYRFYYRQIQYKITRGRRHVVFKLYPDQPDEEITHDFVMDRLVSYGTVNKVVDELLALRETVGDFGEIVYAGVDWVDERLARRSMELMATEVMPRVNAAIGAERGTSAA